MPELPEVERAAKLLRELARGKRVVNVDTTEDTIVFAGVTHEEFAGELSGRIVTDVQRYGKVFYLELDGDGRHPVMHFGMTGTLHVPKKTSTDWPPKFMKFVLHLKGEDDEEAQQGRIRLCKTPLTEPPISTLGFDPIISMPDFEYFKKGVLKRSCPIKALLLDQSFSAGVGNWVAVCRFAVAVNADDSKFPEEWLFRHRWGKGKKEKHTLKLPDGKPATIKWITVGGRTSAYVAELQKLRRGVAVSNVRGGSFRFLSMVSYAHSLNACCRAKSRRRTKVT
ncbi:Formamidopyrimidine-DNA glycosylase N-terminal domain-containing protein [Ganoderma leucocontextum]|nr:Formamidopyrimidine-DNA glycosylase N-terminal domain-containing protein [Ganoderma leucocontextum]